MYTEEDLPDDYYTETEMEEIETMYMGTESEARKRYQRQGPPRRQSKFEVVWSKSPMSSLWSKMGPMPA